MNDTPKKRILSYLAVTAVTLAWIYLPMLLDLAIPALSKSMDFYASILISSIKCLLYIAYIALFFTFAKRLTGFTPFGKKSERMGLKQIITIYALTVVAIFTITVSINFNLNITYMLGFYTTMDGAMVLITDMLVYGFKVYMSLIAMCYCQEAFELILGGLVKYHLPYGGVIMFLTFGIVEMLIGIPPVRWILWFCNIIYGIIYLVSGKRFYTAFLAFIFIYLF